MNKNPKNFFSKLKISQRLILVYGVGCLLPILIVFLYSYHMSREILVERYVTDERKTLEKQTADIEKAMANAVDLSYKISYDEDEMHIVLSDYDEVLISVGYQDYEELKSYFTTHYEGVEDVTLYIADAQRIDNRRFKLITDIIREKEWFVNVMESDGPSWYYRTNVQTGRKSLSMARCLSKGIGRSGKQCVLCISLDAELTESYFANNSMEDKLSMLILNDEKLVNPLPDVSEEEILALVSQLRESKGAATTYWNGKRYIISFAEAKSNYSEDKYTLLTLTPYKSFLKNANVSTMRTFAPLLFCVGLTIAVIFILSRWLARRMGAFSKAMHEAAEGRPVENDKEIGSARDEIYDCYHDLESMIASIKDLTEAQSRARLKEEQIYSRQKDVELKMLATQINPHFLYNTLENIHMLACIGNQPEIEEISVALTQFLRKSLDVGNTLKTVAWEMEMVESYITIQNYRFEDRIRTEIKYDKEKALQYVIMPFVIQPFVENAYVHAMEEVDEGGLITVTADFGEELLTLKIEDNGHGMDADTLTEIMNNLNDTEHLDRSHIGICNVNQRIKLKYGESYGVVFKSVEGQGTTVEITMPLQNA